jgi:hypothetical protein
MTGASAWMMTLRWDVRHVLLLWMMWAVMMAGMMLPSASPLLLMYGGTARRQGFGMAAGRQIYEIGNRSLSAEIPTSNPLYLCASVARIPRSLGASAVWDRRTQ